MDTALWQAATSAGVDARSETAVLRLEGHGPFQIQTTAGLITTRAIINTSGRWSNLTERPQANGASPSSPGGSSPKWIGLKAHFAEVSPSPTTDLYFFDGGYCGMQPVGLGDEPATSRIVVCSMVRADVATRLEDLFPLEPRLRERSRSWKRLSEPVSTAPLIFREPNPEKDGIFFAGDAAGFIDPFVGDGISLALRSGALAADALLAFLRGENELANAIAQYRKAYEKQLLPVFQASSFLRRMLALPAPVRWPLLQVMETFPAIPRFMMRNTR